MAILLVLFLLLSSLFCLSLPTHIFGRVPTIPLFGSALTRAKKSEILMTTHRTQKREKERLTFFKLWQRPKYILAPCLQTLKRWAVICTEEGRGGVKQDTC